MRIDVRRALLGGVPVLVGSAPAVVLISVAGDRLPERLATHFTVTGAADNFMSRGAALAVHAGLGLGVAVLLGVVAGMYGRTRAAGSRRDGGRVVIALGWGVGALLGVVTTAAVAVNLDRTAPADALPLLTPLLAFAAALVAGTLGWLVAPRAEEAGEEPVAAAPLRLGTTEQVSWTRIVDAPAAAVGGAVLIVGGIVLAILAQPFAGIAVALAGALIALFTRARVTVDRRGLTVGLGPVGLPRLRIPAEEVASAATAHVSPLQFGGWGYRIIPGGSGVVLRTGPALVVTRRSGRRFTVTVDDAGTAAALLVGVAGRT